METTKSKRVKSVFQWLIFSGYGNNQEEIGKLLGYSNKSSISQILNGRIEISSKFINKLCSIDERLNKVWVETGEGEMLINSLPTDTTKECIVTSGKTIKYWQDIDATCGGTEIFTDCDSAKIINLQIPDFKDCTDAINIYGDSMYPQYKNGQIILLKKWEESYIEYGCAYLIVTTGGHRMVKQLRKAPDESNVICYSVNQEFEQFEIPKKDILSLWLVKGSIDKSNI